MMEVSDTWSRQSSGDGWMLWGGITGKLDVLAHWEEGWGGDRCLHDTACQRILTPAAISVSI